MQITISGKPQFRFVPTIAILKEIRKEGVAHYDGTCRTMATSPTSFLNNAIAWAESCERHNVEFPDNAVDAPSVCWDFGTLDLVMKMTEYPIKLKQSAEMAEFRIKVRAALELANRLVSTWEYKLP